MFRKVPRTLGLSRLHFLTQDDEHVSHASMAEAACRGGVGLVQLRAKQLDLPEWIETALEVKSVCDKFGAVLIVNDSPEVAKAVGAYGVHLGKKDMPLAEAREILGPDYIIGGTANTAADVLALIESEADYIGVGPFRFTTTKEELSPLLGLPGIRHLVRVAEAARPSCPLIAIGGIQQGDLESLMETGVYGFAISGAITKAPSMQDSAAGFVRILQENAL